MVVNVADLESQTIEAIDTSSYNRGLVGSEWVSNSKNVAVTFSDGGVILFDFDGGGAYEAHVLLKSRGKQAVAQGKAAIAELFGDHGAFSIYGLTPVDNRAARLYARLVGFESYGILDTDHGSCELFQIIKGVNR